MKKMSDLSKYIEKHVVMGNSKEKQPTVDVQFFKVALKHEPDKDALLQLIKNHIGVFNNVDLLDGKEHSYIEIGGWIGDQGFALKLMGMGKLLGLWELLTPTSMLGSSIPDELKMQLAGSGMISIQAKK